ncbi:MAG TPA: pyrimidine dimer DNA glycosylase/endonuclease V [Bacteroidales bacterium]|jgi:hypothetical protein|nr:hypothetical protein [Bacteroidales bacterium]MDI9574765.1 pyrimidine dimer DNA glycosylase/endonuclease V [Bacteroidota bacterium]MBP9512653.1 hypothetical protein [Bacteroidales bacterium]MBP9589196.1 hypothetical protein [Bacteroidales bacterium]NMD16795.1 hypothetical protein [Bacteroidales bacterium]
MRIWSIHPKYLDSKGIIALWKEALLALIVLMGNTRGYRNHPQLLRLRQLRKPLKSIDFYLNVVWQEAQNRGYNFDVSKFKQTETMTRIAITEGQVEFQLHHLLNKLKKRDVKKYNEVKIIDMPVTHPLFYLVAGEVESWEKI